MSSQQHNSATHPVASQSHPASNPLNDSELAGVEISHAGSLPGPDDKIGPRPVVANAAHPTNVTPYAAPDPSLATKEGQYVDQSGQIWIKPQKPSSLEDQAAVDSDLSEGDREDEADTSPTEPTHGYSATAALVGTSEWLCGSSTGRGISSVKTSRSRRKRGDNADAEEGYNDDPDQWLSTGASRDHLRLLDSDGEMGTESGDSEDPDAPGSQARSAKRRIRRRYHSSHSGEAAPHNGETRDDKSRGSSPDIGEGDEAELGDEESDEELFDEATQLRHGIRRKRDSSGDSGAKHGTARRVCLTACLPQDLHCHLTPFYVLIVLLIGLGLAFLIPGFFMRFETAHAVIPEPLLELPLCAVRIPSRATVQDGLSSLEISTIKFTTHYMSSKIPCEFARLDYKSLIQRNDPGVGLPTRTSGNGLATGHGARPLGTLIATKLPAPLPDDMRASDDSITVKPSLSAEVPSDNTVELAVDAVIAWEARMKDSAALADDLDSYLGTYDNHGVNYLKDPIFGAQGSASIAVHSEMLRTDLQYIPFLLLPLDAKGVIQLEFYQSQYCPKTHKSKRVQVANATLVLTSSNVSPVLFYQHYDNVTSTAPGPRSGSNQELSARRTVNVPRGGSEYVVIVEEAFPAGAQIPAYSPARVGLATDASLPDDDHLSTNGCASKSRGCLVSTPTPLRQILLRGTRLRFKPPHARRQPKHVSQQPSRKPYYMPEHPHAQGVEIVVRSIDLVMEQPASTSSGAQGGAAGAQSAAAGTSQGTTTATSTSASASTSASTVSSPGLVRHEHETEQPDGADLQQPVEPVVMLGFAQYSLSATQAQGVALMIRGTIILLVSLGLGLFYSSHGSLLSLPEVSASQSASRPVDI